MGKALLKYKDTPQPILLMDVCSPHLGLRFLRALARWNIWSVFIPGRTTWLLQPCDTHRFAASKGALRTMFEQCLLESEDGTADIRLESCYSRGDPRQGVGTCIRWQWLVKSTAVGETYDFDNLGVQDCARVPKYFAQPGTVRSYLPKAALHSFGRFAESLPRGGQVLRSPSPQRSILTWMLSLQPFEGHGMVVSEVALDAIWCLAKSLGSSTRCTGSLLLRHCHHQHGPQASCCPRTGITKGFPQVKGFSQWDALFCRELGLARHCSTH